MSHFYSHPSSARVACGPQAQEALPAIEQKRRAVQAQLGQVGSSLGRFGRDFVANTTEMFEQVRLLPTVADTFEVFEQAHPFSALHKAPPVLYAQSMKNENHMQRGGPEPFESFQLMDQCRMKGYWLDRYGVGCRNTRLGDGCTGPQASSAIQNEMSAAAAEGRPRRAGPAVVPAAAAGARYSRLDSDIAAMQRDSGTYCDEPENSDDYAAWLQVWSLATL